MTGLQNADLPTLRYEVPPGQDPAVVLVGLRQAGYDASADSDGPPSPIVIIGGTGSAPDREAVRRALTDLDGTNVVPQETAGSSDRRSGSSTSPDQGDLSGDRAGATAWPVPVS